MTKSIFQTTVLVAAATAFVTGCHQPQTTQLDRQVIAEVMVNSEFSSNLRALAMPGGRLSGSENGHKAEKFVAGKLREYGLANVHFEPFEMLTWQDYETVVTVLSDEPLVLEGSYALGNTMSTPEDGVTAEVVDIGKGLPEDFENHSEEIKGRFVMAKRGGAHRGSKMHSAIEHDAVGILHISHLEDQAQVGTCHSEPRPELGVAITGASGKKLTELLAENKPVKINVKVNAKSWQCKPNNVVGEIPGTGPHADEVVILCAHLDSWHLAEGAIDNGNGSVTILETARALSALDWKPDRTIRFIWFMGEEHGLFGSKAYVENHLDEMDNIIAVINVDMPGIPNQYGVFGHPEIYDFLHEHIRGLSGFEIDNEIAEWSWGASDHGPFMQQGVCALSLAGTLGDGAKYYHSAGDTYDIVDRKGTTLSSAVLGVLARQLADCSSRPTVRFDPKDVDAKAGW